MNSNYLHVDLPATVIKDSVSDAMINQKEETIDSNPWENAVHNDSSCLETTAAAPSLFRGEGEKKNRGVREERKMESDFLFLSTPQNFLESTKKKKRKKSGAVNREAKRERRLASNQTQQKVTSSQIA